MSEIVKEKTIMDEVRDKYIRFVSDSLMMSEYEKRQLYLKDKELHLKEQKELSREEGRKAGIVEGRKAGIVEGRKAGIVEGRKAGILEERLNLAKGLKTKNMDISLIVELTGLSIEEIEKL